VMFQAAHSSRRLSKMPGSRSSWNRKGRTAPGLPKSVRSREEHPLSGSMNRIEQEFARRQLGNAGQFLVCWAGHEYSEPSGLADLALIGDDRENAAAKRPPLRKRGPLQALRT
jgi:hypothetical protein